MTRIEVVNKLKKEGYAATVGRIRQALMHGYLRPLPEKGARGAYQFTSRHLKQLRWYFVYIRPGPKPPNVIDLPIRGSADRFHRLAREKQRLRERGPSERTLRQQRQGPADATIRNLEQLNRQLTG